MPKHTAKIASKAVLKSKTKAPSIPSSFAGLKRVKFTPSVQPRDEVDVSSDSGAEESSPPDEPDIRSMFARRIRNWPEEKILEFEDRMRSPYNLTPIPSTRNSRKWQYHFGYYITPSEIREFSEEYNAEWPKDPKAIPPDPMAFIEYMLSFAMLDGREVKLRGAWVRKEDKERLPSIEEDVGQDCYVLSVLSLTDYRRGYRPRYVEVRELTKVMRRKPFWWEVVL
ncbi:hypothetical protein EIP91_002509 [Steccherinum ochraceum]|uniref:Uncharacterized protein n=1 Tax=Steccherinum ochraceum TaxID=92696 RepID=A0A4R0RID1_9APHY|nr:hypothetical protein EIP91_002509 [Steccherinum ochraceum]